MIITTSQLKAALIYAYETLIGKKHSSDKNGQQIDKNQPLHKLVIQRDYYYRRYVKWEDCLNYMFVILFIQICTIITTLLITQGSLAFFQLLTTFIVIELIISLAVSIFLPIFLLDKYFKKLVPRMYSLADEDSEWQNKALTLILPGELLRFFLGLLPLPLLKFGTLTSPVIGYLYSAVFGMIYFDNAMLYEASLTSPYNSLPCAVFFIVIYLIYFALHLYTVLYIINRQRKLHKKYLLGNLNTYNKSQNFTG